MFVLDFYTYCISNFRQLAEILNKNGSVLNLLVNDSLNGSTEKTKPGKLLNKSGGEKVSNNLSHKSNLDDTGW